MREGSFHGAKPASVGPAGSHHLLRPVPGDLGHRDVGSRLVLGLALVAAIFLLSLAHLSFGAQHLHRGGVVLRPRLSVLAVGVAGLRGLGRHVVPLGALG